MSLSRREILGAFREVLAERHDAGYVDRVMARVEKKSRGKSLDVNDYTNLLLRESWREEHGDTSEWDRCAIEAGETRVLSL